MARSRLRDAALAERLAHEWNPLGGFLVVALMAACDLRGTLCIFGLLVATGWFLIVSD